MCCEDPVTTVFIALPALIGGQRIGRNPACPPPTNEASLLYSQCAGRLLSVLPSNVHVRGLACVHGVTARARVCVCEGASVCLHRLSGS